MSSSEEDEAQPAGIKAIERVGYRNPPMKTRFQKGKSGNPKGRPRKTKSDEDYAYEFIDQAVEVATPEDPRLLRRRDVAVAQIMLKAQKGDLKAMAYIDKSYPDRKGAQEESEAGPSRQLSDEGFDLLEAHRKYLQERVNHGK